MALADDLTQIELLPAVLGRQRLVTNLFSEPWFVWALTLALGFPILAVVFGEMTDRLEREGRAFASVARALRNFGLPTVVVFLFVTKVLDFDGETTVARLTLTALWTALLFVALTALNVLLFEQAGSDSVESAIRNHELAFRMQASVPELMDISGESKTTLELYGMDSSNEPTAIFARWRNPD